MSTLKASHLFILVLLSLPFQSCFEIIEQLQLAKDGSGNFQITVNLSKSKTRISSILKMETINGHPIPTKEAIVKKIIGVGAAMEKAPGISIVKTTADMDNYIATMSCNFTSLTQLNKAIKIVKIKEHAKESMLQDHYAYDVKAGIFQRENKLPLREMYAGVSKADREIFADATYTSVFKFDAPVIGMSNKNATLSVNKNAVMLRETALDVITQKRSIENTINITH